MNLMEHCRAAGFSEPLSRQKNLELYSRLKTDPAAREEMIMGNLALATVKVESFLSEVPQMAYYRDDLISVAASAIMRAVDMLKKSNQKIKNPTGYIYRSIEVALSNVSDEESTISISRETKRVARKEGKDIDEPVAMPQSAQTTLFAALETPNELALMELKEEIEACCQDETDLKIVRMRADGYTDQEICQETGINDATISYRGKRIEDRFVERCPEYGRRA